MVGTLLLFIIVGIGFSSSAIMLLYPAVLSSGAQSITADRDTRRSNDPNSTRKYNSSIL